MEKNGIGEAIRRHLAKTAPATVPSHPESPAPPSPEPGCDDHNPSETPDPSPNPSR